MSILDSIKSMLGMELYDASDLSFETDVIIGINSALMALNQLGVGAQGYSVSGSSETWEEFLMGRNDWEAAKTYVYLKVKLVFDTPTNSFVVDALKEQIQEYEWRLNLNAERGDD